MAKKSSPPKIKKKRGWFFKLFVTGIVLSLLGVIALGFTISTAYSTLPEFKELRTRDSLGQVIRVRANDGSILASLGPTYGEWIEYKSIPQSMVNAMVAVEDKRFRSHYGVDPVGLARAARVRWDEGRWKQGASTITQQLARNIFLTNKKDFGRKGREMILALAMEWKYDKDQILELYLNRVYFGGGAYGIDAASRRFFDHPGKTLSLPEAAIIAGLVKAPSNYAPTADPTAALGRAGVVLGMMAEQGMISPDEAKKVSPKTVKLAVEKTYNNARYFIDWALPQIDGLIEETSKPIDIWTTLDMKLQNAADGAIRTQTPGGLQGALVSLDRDGAVRAMVGGKDYVSSIYNRATQAVRQPGSSFKLFVYLAALEAGMTPETRVVDEPVNIAGWKPKNANGGYMGAISLRKAFTYSTNTIAAKIGQEVGTSSIQAMARRFGITTPVNGQPSMVLGTSEVRLIDLTRAFAAVSAEGRSIEPYGIIKVTTANGQVLYRRPVSAGTQLVEPWVAGGMIDLLQSAVSEGTGKNAQIGRPVGGKTGTTQSNKDAWFMGFSSGITTGVWMGSDTPKATSVMGGLAPARAWANYMRTAVANRPVEKFNTDVEYPSFNLETNKETVYEDGSIAAPSHDGGFVDENGMPLDSGGGGSAPSKPKPVPDTPEGRAEEFDKIIDDVMNEPPRSRDFAPE
jgi:penicillin-binding protein 1A